MIQKLINPAWNRTRTLLEPEEYAAKVAEHYDYNRPIFFDKLPGKTAGATSPRIDFGQEGFKITGSSIQIDSRLAETFNQQYRDTIHHEIIHGKQFDKMSDRDETYTSAEMQALLPLQEGQTTHNVDEQVYPYSRKLYEELLSRTEENDPDDALESLSEDYRIGVLQFNDGTYQSILVNRDLVETNRDIIEDLDKWYDIDGESSYEIDYRDNSIDTQKIGETILDVQEDLDQTYKEIRESSPQLLPGR